MKTTAKNFDKSKYAKQKTNLNFNKAYYIGKHLAMMILALYLVQVYISEPWLQTMLVLVLDYLLLKLGIIRSLEADNGFVIKKSALDGSFIVGTDIGLILLGLAFNYTWWSIIVLIVFNSLCFNFMDANDEKRIKEANKDMKKYLKDKKEKITKKK